VLPHALGKRCESVAMEAAELATLEWVDWFNHKRLLGSIGHIPPALAEAAYYRQQTALPKAA